MSRHRMWKEVFGWGIRCQLAAQVASLSESAFGSRSGGADVANSHIRVEDYLENPFALLFSGWMEVQFSGRMWIQCPLS